MLGVVIVDRVYRKIDGETRYNTMHKDVARNGGMQHRAGVRLIADDGGVRVSSQLQRNFSHYTRNAETPTKSPMKSFAARKTARRENYNARRLSVCRRMLIRESIVRTNHRISLCSLF